MLMFLPKKIVSKNPVALYNNAHSVAISKTRLNVTNIEINILIQPKSHDKTSVM